jgi:hypothetical protein
MSGDVIEEYVDVHGQSNQPSLVYGAAPWVNTTQANTLYTGSGEPFTS